MDTALLIIDVQVAMFSGEDGGVYHSSEVLGNIRMLIEKARSISMPVIFIQHTEEDEFKEGSDTWKIHPDIAPLENETVIQKRTWDSFNHTSLEDELKRLDTRNLIIVGMQTEFCIDTTCRRAFSLGFNNILVKDAHTTFDSKILKASQIIEHLNETLGGRIVELRSAKELAAQLSR